MGDLELEILRIVSKIKPGGDATATNQATIIADTEKLYDGSLGISPADGSLASFIATGGTALGTRLPASVSLLDILGSGYIHDDGNFTHSIRRHLRRGLAGANATTVLAEGKSILDALGHDGTNDIDTGIMAQLQDYVTDDAASIYGRLGAFTGPVGGTAQGDNVKASLDLIHTYLDGIKGTNFVAADNSLHAIAVEIAEILDLTRSAGDIAVTAAETDLYIDDAPTKILNGLSIKIDTTNMAAGDTYEFREYYRIESGGSLLSTPKVQLSGAQADPLYVMHLEPYLYGMKITAKKTAGTDRSFKIEVIRET